MQKTIQQRHNTIQATLNYNKRFRSCCCCSWFTALKIVLNALEQWFLTLLEVLNPASFISAFTEPFVIGKIKYDFFKTYFICSFIHVNPYCTYSSNHFLFLLAERLKENHKWRTITTATSRLLSSLQHRHQSQAMWRDQLQPMMAKRSVTTNTSGLNLFCVTQNKFGAGLLGGGNNTRRGKNISRGKI